MHNVLIDRDCRRPFPYLVGAFLKFGKLDSAEPCPAIDCGFPATQFNKKVIVDLEWQEEFADPATAEAIDAMDVIAKILDDMILSSDEMVKSGYNGAGIKSLKAASGGGARKKRATTTLVEADTQFSFASAANASDLDAALNPLSGEESNSTNTTDQITSNPAQSRS
jgi:hypothetical protein